MLPSRRFVSTDVSINLTGKILRLGKPSTTLGAVGGENCQLFRMQLNEESFITLEAFPSCTLLSEKKAAINGDGKKVEDKRARSAKGEDVHVPFPF